LGWIDDGKSLPKRGGVWQALQAVGQTLAVSTSLAGAGQSYKAWDEEVAMNAITIKPDLEKDAVKWAAASGQTLDAFVETAIARLVEDLEDIAAAEEALKDYDPAKNVSLEQLRRELGLDA
jgi:RHH-type transcriptional regulator, rel operon repressor / antitoxin RelB